MKHILLSLLAVVVLFGCTKTKTNYVNVPVPVYSFTRNLWVNADGSGLTLSFSADSIFEVLPPFSSIPFGYPYSVSHDTINLPTRGVKMKFSVSADSLIYDDFANNVVTRFYRD